MTRHRRLLSVLLLALFAVTACGGTEVDSPATAPQAEADSGDTGEPTAADELLAELAEQVDYEFEASVFVLEEGEVDFSGPRDRRYSFDSITKTMTGLLLAHLHEAEELDLSTPVGEILDAGANADVTMLEMATHTSGLPETAANGDQWDGYTDEQPYAGYTPEMAEAALREAEIDEDVGYSNFAFQILGMSIEEVGEDTLGGLAEDLIFGPAGMVTADIPVGERGLPDGLVDGEPVPAWDNLLTGDGGAGGTIADLAAYAEFMLAPPAESAAAVDIATTAHIQEDDGTGSGLDWLITPEGLLWHAGASDAYNSIIVLDPETNRAVGYLTATGDLDEPAIDLFLEYFAA